MGLDTKFVFLGWPKAKIWAIQFSEDFDGGHFEKCPKRWGRPNLYGVNISIIDQWGPLNKIIPLIEDPGGGCTVTPLGPWTIIYNKNCGVSFWTCSREISGDRVALFPLLYICLLCYEVLLPWNFRSPGFEVRPPRTPPPPGPPFRQRC